MVATKWPLRIGTWNTGRFLNPQNDLVGPIASTVKAMCPYRVKFNFSWVVKNEPMDGKVKTPLVTSFFRENIVDLWIERFPPDVAINEQDVQLSNALDECACRILSVFRPGTVSRDDVLTSFKVFSSSVLFMVAIIVLLLSIIISYKKYMRSQRLYIPWKDIVLVTIVLSIFQLRLLHSAGFKTNLARESKIKHIDSIDDLLRDPENRVRISDIEPCKLLIENSVFDKVKKLAERRVNMDQRIVKYTRKGEVNRLSFVTDTTFQGVQSDWLCSQSKGLLVHQSEESFEKKTRHFVQSKNYNQTFLINTYIERLFEMGNFKKATKILRSTLQQVFFNYNGECLDNIRKRRFQSFEALNLYNFKLTYILFVSNLLIAIIIFAAQVVVN